MRYALKNTVTGDIIRYEEFTSQPPVLASAKKLLWAADPYIAPQPTEAEIVAEITAKIQARLDNFAKTRNYDGILSACTYTSSLVPKFAAEASYCVTARDGTWATGYTILSDVKAGNRPMPTWEEIEAELPTLVWPA